MLTCVKEAVRNATLAVPTIIEEQLNATFITKDWEVISEAGIDLED